MSQGSVHPMWGVTQRSYISFFSILLLLLPIIVQEQMPIVAKSLPMKSDFGGDGKKLSLAFLFFTFVANWYHRSRIKCMQ